MNAFCHVHDTVVQMSNKKQKGKVYLMIQEEKYNSLL